MKSTYVIKNFLNLQTVYVVFVFTFELIAQQVKIHFLSPNMTLPSITLKEQCVLINPYFQTHLPLIDIPSPTNGDHPGLGSTNHHASLFPSWPYKMGCMSQGQRELPGAIADTYEETFEIEVAVTVKCRNTFRDFS